MSTHLLLMVALMSSLQAEAGTSGMWENNADMNDRFKTVFELRRLGATIESCLQDSVYSSEANDGERTEAHQAYYTSGSVFDLSDRIRERIIESFDSENQMNERQHVMYVVQLLTREAEQMNTARSLVERMPTNIQADYCRSALQEGGYQLGVGPSPIWQNRD